MQKEIIVIIGAPGSGKSSIINSLITKGYCCYPEISREVTLQAQKKGVNQLFLENPLLFSEQLLEGRTKQFKSAQNELYQRVFIDRGIPDIVAYLDYIGQTYPPFFDLACRENKYTKIFILPPWKEIYENDGERYEDFEQAKIIHEYLIDTYRKYNYHLIEVPKDTVDTRILYILDILNKI